MIWITAALGLPMYAQRSGRTCGNCHVSPTLEDPEGWPNPKVLERKCTLSCTSCHVDPAGGGLRNASGRYFAGSTLAMIPTRSRSYSDHEREWLSPEALWAWRSRFARPEGDRTVSKRPPHRMGYLAGRFERLAADPVVQFGGDLRLAYYTGTRAFFPMQADLHGAVHPVEHVSLVVTGAMQSRSVKAPPVFARRAFVMAHELPGNAWIKAGAFQPSHGTLLADHTAPIRHLFEGSFAESRNTVIGVEAGLAPNYPFASVAVFANDARWVGAVPDSGWGATAQAGWRGLRGSVSGHAMIRRRREDDAASMGLAWGWSPPWAWDRVPVTWLGEVTIGDRAGRFRAAALSQLSFLVRNGLVLEIRSDLWTRDGSSWQHRHGPAASFTLLPGVSFESTVRMLVAPGDVVRADALGQLHLSF